jgi:peptidyl-prolyl cis-trans isomerase D
LTHPQLPPELQKAVSGLSKAGQITLPIRTKQGFVLVKVIDIKEPKTLPFETVKNQVREAYAHQHTEEKFAELREKLANLTYEHPDSLQFAAKALNLPVKTSELFVKDKGGKDISQYKKVRDVAFSNDVLNLQNNSDIIQINPESLIVLRIKSHIASTLLPLKSISKQIEDKIKSDETKVRAEKFSEEIKAKLESGANPAQLAAAYHLTWNKTGYLGRYSTKVDSAILDIAFRLPDPTDSKNKAVYGVTRLPNGYAIVALKALKEGVLTDPKQYAIFSEQVQNSEGLLEYELYKQNELRTAKIKIQQ